MGAGVVQAAAGAPDGEYATLAAAGGIMIACLESAGNCHWQATAPAVEEGGLKGGRTRVDEIDILVDVGEISGEGDGGGTAVIVVDFKLVVTAELLRGEHAGTRAGARGGDGDRGRGRCSPIP